MSSRRSRAAPRRRFVWKWQRPNARVLDPRSRVTSFSDMAQVSRLIRSWVLRLLPAEPRARLLQRSPNWRKAAPRGLRFQYDQYLGDIRVAMDTSFRVDRLMWSGQFEPNLIALIRRHVVEGDICLDVGANIGAATLAFARAVGNVGHVHAFEPAPPNVDRLRANLALNPDLNRRTTVHPVGISDQAGRLFWSHEADNPGNGSLSNSGEHEVPVATLDERLLDAKASRANFMKVDVEGMELNVFQGASKTLRNFRPCIYFETLARFERPGSGGYFNEIEQFLRELDYELYRINRDATVILASAANWSSYAWAVPEEKADRYGK